MFKKILPVFVLCAIALSMASCLEDENEDLVYYDDTAVTGFALGKLNKYIVMKSSTDSDSIVKSTIDASTYKFSINDATHEIYNVDSLPMGVDSTKVVCTINTKNSGLAVWYMKTADGRDSLAYYSSTDSVDFTGGRTLRVYNTNMTAFRQYDVRLNIHQEVADSFVWRQMAIDANIANMQALKMVCNDSYTYIFASNGTATKVYRANRKAFDGFADTESTLGKDAYQNVVSWGNDIYVLDGSVLKIFGKTIVDQNAPISRLLGAGNDRIYAYSTDGGLCYSTDGKQWTACSIDGNTESLPSENINFMLLPSLTNTDSYYLTMVGDTANANFCNVWGKVEEPLDGTEDQPWTEYLTDIDKYKLPALINLQTFVYERKLMAIGGDGINDSSKKALDTFYSSKDAGLTWHADTTLTLPANMQQNGNVFATTIDSDNFIWIACGGSGQIWRGRLNKHGWAIKE